MNRAETIADASPKYRKLVERALDGTCSPRAGIKAFCLRCVGYIRADVEGCTSRNCPLWQFRPYKSGEDTDNLAEGSEETV